MHRYHTPQAHFNRYCRIKYVLSAFARSGFKYASLRHRKANAMLQMVMLYSIIISHSVSSVFTYTRGLDPLLCLWIRYLNAVSPPWDLSVSLDNNTQLLSLSPPFPDTIPPLQALPCLLVGLLATTPGCQVVAHTARKLSSVCYKIKRSILLHVPQEEKLSQVRMHKSEPSVFTFNSIITGS